MGSVREAGTHESGAPGVLSESQLRDAIGQRPLRCTRTPEGCFSSTPSPPAGGEGVQRKCLGTSRLAGPVFWTTILCMQGFMEKWWIGGILAVCGLLATLPQEAAAAEKAGFGKVALKGGETFSGDVVKKMGELLIFRTPDGLRAVPSSAIDKFDPPSGNADPAPRPAGEKAPKATVAPKEKEAELPGSKAAPKAKPVSPQPETPTDNAPDAAVKVEADKRLDEARSGGGQAPVLELVTAGSIEGKAEISGDPAVISRLAYFFGEESAPKFQVLPPGGERGEKASGKAIAGKTPARAGAAEYTARATIRTTIVDIQFYNTPIQKKAQSQVSFQLLRASDKKPVVILEAIEVEDIESEPKNKEDVCRSAYTHAVEALIRRLKGLKTFGGTSSGPESNGTAAKTIRR